MTTAPKLTRAEASRLNGAKSRGPITEEGKRRAALNALKHGLSAETHPVLKHEDAAAYRALLDRLVAHHRPNDPDRVHLVERLASVMWRQRRLDRLEASLFNQSTWVLGAEVRLGVEIAPYEALQRCHVRLDRQLFQLLKQLRETRPEDEEEILDAPANDDAAPLRNEPERPPEPAAPPPQPAPVQKEPEPAPHPAAEDRPAQPRPAPNEPDAERIARLRAADAEAAQALREQLRTGGPEAHAALARGIDLVRSLDEATFQRLLQATDEEFGDFMEAWSGEERGGS
ncbi:MAG: hypothetical protein U1E45_19510 [Geminicoccaceae bacterium]